MVKRMKQDVAEAKKEIKRIVEYFPENIDNEDLYDIAVTAYLKGYKHGLTNAYESSDEDIDD